MLQKSAFMPLPVKIIAPPVESRSAELAAGLQVERFAPWREIVSRKAAKFAKKKSLNSPTLQIYLFQTLRYFKGEEKSWRPAVRRRLRGPRDLTGTL